MTAEREGLTAIETTALPDHMPQLTDAERQTGSGRAEQIAEKGVTPPGVTAVTDIDIVLTDAAGKIDTAGKTGMQIRIGTEAETGMCLAADMVKIAGRRHETGIGMYLSGPPLRLPDLLQYNMSFCIACCLGVLQVCQHCFPPGCCPVIRQGLCCRDINAA